ncbi:MAG: iron-containing alcohol dehydrogenase family protein [Lautropia sp.]
MRSDIRLRNYEHADPARRIVCGPGAIDRAGDLLEGVGVRRALVLVGETMAGTPLFARVLGALGGRVAAVLKGIPPHSGPQWVEQGLELRERHRADGLVSIGGGSSIDTAKCIALVALMGGDIAAHRIVPPGPPSLNAQALRPAALPHLCIPTTGSGSEVTPGAGLRAPDGRKWIFWHVSIPPQVVVLDPAAAASTPYPIAAASSLNSLAHAVESMYAVNRQPLTEAYATAALHRFGRWLPRSAAAPDDAEVRGEIQQAWLLAGLSIANARVALHHAICHGLGARFGVSHGAANAIMLPHVMRFNCGSAQEPLARVARALGSALDDEAAAAADSAGQVERIQAALGVPRRLRDVGVPADQLAALAADTMHERAAHFNPRPVTRDDVLALLRAAW